MSVDLTGFNPRALPDSDALRTQMRETLMRTDPVAAWWMGVLADGEFALKDGAATWTTEIDAAEFRASYELAMARMRNAPPFNVAMQKVGRIPAGRRARQNPEVCQRWPGFLLQAARPG